MCMWFSNALRRPVSAAPILVIVGRIENSLRAPSVEASVLQAPALDQRHIVPRNVARRLARPRPNGDTESEGGDLPRTLLGLSPHRHWRSINARLPVWVGEIGWG